MHAGTAEVYHLGFVGPSGDARPARMSRTIDTAMVRTADGQVKIVNDDGTIAAVVHRGTGTRPSRQSTRGCTTRDVQKGSSAKLCTLNSNGSKHVIISK